MTTPIEIIELPETRTAAVHGRATFAEISAFLDGAFTEAMTVAGRQGAQVTGPPYARYQPTEDGAGFDIEAGFPVDRVLVADGRVVPGLLPGGPAARIVHTGPYDEVGPTYAAATEWLAEHGSVPAGAPWESYLDEPGTVEASRTLVSFPCTPTAGGGDRGQGPPAG